MKKNLLFFFGLLILILAGCSEKVAGPSESGFPEPLYPYETSFDMDVCKQRRDDLMNTLPDNALAILSTNLIHLRNGDVGYEFRPASNFFYLTGFDESNAVAVIRSGPAAWNTSEMILFVQENEDRMVRWLGPTWGITGAVEQFGADSAYAIEELGAKIRSYLNSGDYESVYVNLETNPAIGDSLNTADTIPDIFDIDDIVNAARVIKTQDEIHLIQKAVDVSVQAFKEAMAAVQPNMYEYEAEAIFNYVLGSNGCSRTAFQTIVASGPNINILHYDANYRQMLDGDLVMIDFGAEYGYYAADITRTLPVNGKFTDQQKTVYEIVLEAHRAVIDAAAPGVSYYDLYGLARDIMLDGLLQNGIITGSRAAIIGSNQFRLYIVAGLGHCVGLDAHDPFPADENNDKILQENMVLAFEPHVYLTDGDATVDPAYWGVCARIEDDVLITSTGCEVLSDDLPMDVKGIEKLMK